MLEAWTVTAIANAIMVLIYGLVAIEMIRAIIDGKQLRSNPLLSATAFVFVMCTLGHGDHLAHTLIAVSPLGTAAAAAAAKASFGDPRLLAWDAFTAVVAVYFYTLRSRFAIVYRGAALCEDMAKREADALDLHDNIVQGLAQAKLALDMGRREEGRQAVLESLAAARRMMTDLLGNEASELALGPGDLRRTESAGRIS